MFRLFRPRTITSDPEPEDDFDGDDTTETATLPIIDDEEDQ